MYKHTKPVGQRKVSPPGPSYMSSDQVANYLKDLRTNRPARPTGSRPLPGKALTSTVDLEDDLPPRAASAFSMYRQNSPPEGEPRAGSALSHRRTTSHVTESGPVGRPLAQEPQSATVRQHAFPSQIFSRPVAASPVPSYRESGHRRHEKEEARDLRDALQDMNVQDDDVRVHQAAQDEATELVWMHQNPGQAFKNPYAPYQNPDAGSQGSIRSKFRRSSSSLTNKFRHSVGSSGSSSNPSSPELADATLDKTARRRSSLSASQKKNRRVNFALPGEEPSIVDEPSSIPRPRQVSGDSSKGVFKNPNDHIYEEPVDPAKEAAEPSPDFTRSDSSALRNKPRNALPRVNKPLPWLRDRKTGQGSVRDRISQFDIHKNPPTQSRNASYMENDPLPPTQPRNSTYMENDPLPPTPPSSREEEVPTKEGKEIRSDDIRAATSKRLKDRSENLPMPSAVSDRMGRPIVSFDPKWQSSDQPKRDQQSPVARDSAPSAPPIPTIQVAPSIEVTPTVEVTPSIEVSQPPAIPVINVPDIQEPTISQMTKPSQHNNTKPTRPRQQPAAGHNRQMPPARQASQPQNSWRTQYSRSGVPTASCESCSHSISGKIVTAGGSRFHPECFICFHCHTALECVAFYEEPLASRAERLENNPNESPVPRFYCHLDFHEFFSPRCKSCKTPIEGEVVVACGAEWHVGHFFCAECGDPFDSKTPFVEKDGFAWCLKCHGRRTAPRCLGCKQHVLDDVVITAIGGQWHEQCFACHECGNGFGADGRFFVREGEPKRTAKGRIIGGPVQLAICERCEGLRLKSHGMC
ncbi:hypothetical protein N7509_010533 [Penicillium cosmopolitanum]|uniref:LIM zinc-binding domain-containing protein n=1 Tax=Penicillium cosmopolitanum TaxID=1131564 RepID=A0A9W9VRJ3_9EURO|nr:uncharacterized protein N7509_010533 [Penicillium cosmopolitanum]KAJ5387992.1 hypothetical protein N7509_010533 [Penicillium cosmopolitanum]